MNKWWNWILTAALISLLFIAIPIKYSTERSSEELKSMFKEYVEKFNKSYKNDEGEYATRFQYFVTSLKEIDRLNMESRGPDEHKAKYGLTRISDLSADEYREIHLSDEKMQKAPYLYKRSWIQKNVEGPDIVSKDTSFETNRHHYVYNLVRRKRATLPLQVDWRSKGVIGPIKDQGLCGACWAFSTVGIIEAMAAMDSGKLQPLSVQEVIDCAGLGNSGCLGGDICLLLDWLLMTNTAIQTDKQYPLKLKNGVCKLNKTATGVRVSSFTCDKFVGAEDKILEALATHGPLSVAVNALTWQNYLGGIIQYHCSGSESDLNHAVQLVGYDLQGEVPYYIAKNSWGPDFGSNGYLQLAIGSNICGLANEVASVDVKKT